jgi:2-dehydro-3-deoxyphosphogluconate aldolase / (4S)-4-hydroxy-2-oxoglutarate aldolase
MQSAITEQQVFETISSTKIVPVFYHDDLQISKEMIKACYDGGIRVFEWVARGKHAAEYFPHLKQYIQEYCADMILGAGTILTDKQAEEFIEMGAAFLVSPVYSADVMDKAYYSKVPYLPGCFTPTEIFNACNAGCTWVKVFPGDAVSPSYIKNIKAVMPQVSIMVTGGVKPEKENIENWLSNGADAVGMGNQLFKEMNYEAVKNKVVALF